MSSILVSRRQVLKAAAAVGVAGALPGVGLRSALAADAGDLHWIIYQSPGGLIDGSTRAIQPFLKNLGFPSTVDYVRGASGRIARTQLYRAGADDFSIMTEASPEEVLGEVIYGAQYKVNEFQPVFGWFRNAFNLSVKKGSPIKTFGDLVSQARTRKVTVATIGKGGPSHLQLVILMNKLNLKLQLVHFDGAAPAHTAVEGGHVEVAVGGSTSSAWSDSVDFLVTFRNGRDPAMPDVPTAKELGYDVEPVNEVIYANAGPKMPADRVQKLTAAFTKVFADPAAVAAQKKLGVFPAPITPDELRASIKTMYALVGEFKKDLIA
jgi:tripartite-type tricarboxylate transporter receptor subunit TctC